MLLHVRQLVMLRVILVTTPILFVPTISSAQIVPGTGTLLNSDDFEDANWGYTMNWPKSSKEEDEQIRYPLGQSTNRLWLESPKRGAPDTVKRTETPAGGLAGSTGALYLRTRDTGVPGHPRYKQAQDDFILAAKPVSIAYNPNFTVRVWLPPFEQWEQRSGVSFGIRVGLNGPQTKTEEVSSGRFFKRKSMETVTKNEPYYPGFFIALVPANDPQNKTGKPYARLMIRANEMGHEMNGPIITQTGWWTFGMSVSGDARCHYYAHAGVEELTARDHIVSALPYAIPGNYFNTIFFNVCTGDDGQTWSTPWIIDDPKVYYINGGVRQANNR